MEKGVDVLSFCVLKTFLSLKTHDDPGSPFEFVGLGGRFDRVAGWWMGDGMGGMASSGLACIVWSFFAIFDF